MSGGRSEKNKIGRRQGEEMKEVRDKGRRNEEEKQASNEKMIGSDY